MAKVLLIGASEFGCDLAGVLVRGGFSVDVMDQESIIPNELYRIAEHFYCTNALNIRRRPDIDVASYQSCILCFRGETWMLLHIIESLKNAGAKDIRVRVDHRQKHDMEKLAASGPVRLIDVEQIAGERVAENLREGGCNMRPAQ